MTENTILVTGASGLAGSAVIREFVRSGRPVRALVRNQANARAFRPSRLQTGKPGLFLHFGFAHACVDGRWGKRHFVPFGKQPGSHWCRGVIS